MKKVVSYYAEGDPRPYNTEEAALDKERQDKEDLERLKSILTSPETKLKQLKDNLDKAMYIHPDTIATCSFQSIRIKGLVKVCQAFAEENKQYLNYY